MRRHGLFLLSMSLVVGLSGCGAQPTPEQAEAIALIKSLGGKCKAAEDRPGRPVIEVALGGTPIQDEDLARLACFRELETLSLFDSSIGDAGLLRLKSFENLHTLYLGRTQTTDDGLAALAGMSQLKTLGLSDTRVTDAGLAHLQPLKNLRGLNLRRTRTTAAGVRELKQSLPQLVVHL